LSLNWLGRRKVVPPYTCLAEVYDYLMRHVNYKQWAGYIHELIQQSGEPIHTVLDVACGTGNLIFELIKRHYQLKGFDYSKFMVARAKDKARMKALDIPFWVSDIRHFTLHQKQDAIICLYDSINYLQTIEDFKLFYNSCYDNLRLNGLCIFDICTEWNSINHFQNYVDKGSTKHFRYTRKSHYNHEDRIHFNDFRVVFKDNHYIYYEYHRQKIYYIDEILASIPESKFKILGAYHEFTQDKATEGSDRVHFLLQKHQ